MTKSLLIVAAALLCASPAWAIDAPSPQGSGNSVNGALATPAQPAAPAPTYAPPSMNGPDIYHAMAPGSFNPAAYRTTTDCLNAAEAAHAQLGQCEQH